MANISQSTVENFFGMLGSAAQEVVNASPSDLTIDAEIVKIGDVSNGEYKVSYQGAIFSAYCEDRTVTYKTGERVYVLVPQGDMSRKKLIYGRSSYKNENVAGIDAVKNFYIDQGPNWVDLYKMPSEMGICACPGEKEPELIVPANYSDFGFLRGTHSSLGVMDSIIESEEEKQWKKIDEQFKIWSNSDQYLKIQADFQTKFSGPHVEGKYALQVNCLQLNPKYVEDETSPNYSEKEKKYKIITFELDFADFTGVSPYSITEPSTQKGYFEIPTGNLMGIFSVALIQDGAMKFDIPISFDATGLPLYLETDAIKNENNILVSNLQITFAKKVNLVDTMYYPYIEAPMGKSVYGETPDFAGRPMVELIAHLQYGDTDITEQENCRVRWFRQKADVTQSSIDTADKDEFGQNFFYYGGPGWYPVEKINEEQQSVDVEEERLYKVEGNKLTIYRDAVPWKWKYKAVIVYGTKEVDPNDGHEYIREINKSYAIEEITRDDSIYDLELKTLEEELPGYYEIVNNKDTKEDKKPWVGHWFLADPSGGYNSISVPFHEGPLNILENPFYDRMSIAVQCYDPYQYYPTSDPTVTSQDAHEIGVLELEFNSRKDVPFTVSWEGEDFFKYDAQGAWRGEKDPKEYVLTPKIKFAEGYACSYSIEVLAPDDTVLGDKDYYRNTSDKQSEAFNCWKNDDFLVTQAYIDRYFGIHFSVSRTYNKEKAKNNIFKINVLTSNQEKFTFTKQVTFMKDGDMGSNGTIWDAQLRPCKWRSTSKENLFVVPYADDHPYPLVVDRIEGTTFYKQNENFRMFLRPYVTRAGVPIESLDKEQAFFYRCSWDVRVPGAEALNDSSSWASFLRLYHTARGVVSGGSEANGPFIATRGAAFNVANGGAFETGAQGKDEEGLCANNPSPLKNIKVNTSMRSSTTSSGWKEDPVTGAPTINGLVAHTVYPLNPEKRLAEDAGARNPFINPDNECFGAVEVGYFENSNPAIGTGATLEECHYRFIVKCTIDVIQGSYDYGTNVIETASSTRTLTTLTCYYPVDIFFNERNASGELNINFDEVDPEAFREKINTTWPTAVKYDSLGYDPEHSDELMKFWFADGDNVHPYNLTPGTINLEKVNVVRDEERNEVSYDYKLTPSGHLSKQDGFHGAIKTVANGLSFAKDSWYLRNIIMYYDRYGNVDINGWDGQGLDTNEEDGTIFGATFGAGWKDNLTNAFTGVLMGVDKSLKREDYQENLTNLEGASEAEGNHPYLTGLFGYQEGIKSFGLLENGTAFFGRADGGGRIIIDGSNATIYGGANGKFTTPSIGDPMWNTLRINLVDLNHAKDRQLWRLEPNPAGSTSPENAQIPAGYHVVNENGEPVDISLGGQSFGFAGASGDGEKASYIIPDWYAKMWRNAYLQPLGARPYWMLTHEDPVSKTQVPYEIDELGWWDGKELPPVEDAKDPQNNKKINYLDCIWIGLNTEYIKTNYLNKPEYGNIPSLPSDFGLDQYEYFPLQATGAPTGVPSIEGDEKPNKILTRQLNWLRAAGAKLSLSSYGPQRASTTPAIEIGQHIPGLRPGLIDWGEYTALYENQRIPGDRNFMVTYDGTLWAMNGVFMGNVIGSNIVGGRIQATQIGVGPRVEDIADTFTKNVFTFYGKYEGGPEAQYTCDWDNLRPPFDAPTSVEFFPFSKTGYSMTLSEQGVSSIGGEVIGGSIDIGHFHVIGNKTIERLDALERWDKSMDVEDELGHLVQTGKSDFIGLTHFYGNIGIAPSADGDNSRANSGSLVQIGGFTALGVLLPEGGTSGLDLKSHHYINEYVNNTARDYYSGFIPRYMIGEGGSVEASSVFAIDSRGSNDVCSDFDGVGINGHFWPLHFHTHRDGNDVISYVTMMDQFRTAANAGAGGGGTHATNFEGSNYFRISPWGVEGQEFFVRNRFQPESYSQRPEPDANAIEGTGGKAYRGYIGSVSRAGHPDATYAPDQGALGITTWNNNAIVFHSDDATAIRTRRGTFMTSNFQSSVSSASTFTEINGDDDTLSNICFSMTGSYTDGNIQYGFATLRTVVSPINLAVIKKGTTNGANEAALGDATFRVLTPGDDAVETGALFSLNPDPESTGYYSSLKSAAALACTSGGNSDALTGGGVHLFCFPNDKSATKDSCLINPFSEIFISEKEVRTFGDNKVGLYSKTEVVLEIGGTNVHTTPASFTKGLSFKADRFEIKGYAPDTQFGVYARFG